MQKLNRFDRRTFTRFWKIAKLFFSSDARWIALGLCLLLVAFSLSLSSLNVLRSFVDRDFMNALAKRDESQFFHELMLYGFLFAGLIPLAVFYRYTEERLGLLWRDWLSRRILDGYLTKGAYYKISLNREIDNPDQRIEEDIRTFTASSLSFILILFNSVVALIAFVSILWSISGWLMLGAIVYAALGSVITYFLGKNLIGLNFAQLKKEADYRYKLVNLRDSAESIALYRGERRERLRVREKLQDVILNMRSIINWNRNLGFFTNGYNYILAILPTIIVAPLYLKGQIEFGVVVQAGGAFGQVLGALSIIVVHFGGLSALAAVTNRLGSFWEALEEAQRQHQERSHILVTDSVPGQSDQIIFENLTLHTPQNDRELVRALSLVVAPDQHLLITGPSGAGKSSILRVLSGLWTFGSGKVQRPALSRCFFVPQRPYMVIGSFRSQLFYGSTQESLPDSELRQLLDLCGLAPTVERIGGLDVEEDWRGILSMGEQELVGFARALIAKPEVLFLDEATSAVDGPRQKLLYGELQRRGIRYLSVGLASELEQFHTHVLELKGNGAWSLREAGSGT